MLPFSSYSIPESENNGIPKNAKWLCVIIDQPPSDAEKELLLKISTALKADFDKDVYTIVRDHSETASIHKPDLSGIKLIISFGVPSSSIGIWIDLPGPGIRMLESYSFIRTASLKTLAGSAPAKKDLWSAMQEYTSSLKHG